MLKWAVWLCLVPMWLCGGIFDWLENISPRAQRAKDVLEGFDEIIEQALVDFAVPGIAVGIVVDGHVIYEKGFGLRDVEKGLPMTKDTIFPIGSFTKGFSSFVMGTLVDEGLVYWDEPVIDVLPEFHLYDQFATTNVTLRDLMTHRTGMPRHEFVWYNTKMSKSELLRRLRFLQPSAEIRERYQYGQLMYFTAGLAMEAVTGKKWEELVQERILTPLNMSHTSFTVGEMLNSNDYANGYLEKNNGFKKMAFRDFSVIGAAGCMNSTVEDLTHWIQMQISGGVYQNQSLISAVTLQELHAPQIVVPGAPESDQTLLYSYAIGWGVVSYRGHYFVSHDGVSDGFTSVIGMFPGEDIGIVILANRNITTLPRYLSFAMIDRILELPFHDWIKEGFETGRKNREKAKETKVEDDRMRKKGTCPCHPLEEYVGVYEHPGYGKVSVELIDGKLEANFNDLIFVLGHWHYDVFNVAEEKQDMIVSFEGTKFTFINNSNGDIGELVIPFEPRVDDIVFKRRPTEKHSTLNYLKQFTGTYEIYGYTVEIILRDHSLFAVIPGQPKYELVPANENEFAVKSVTGSTVRFVLNEEKRVEEVLLIHPYGAFTARPKR